jgi:F-type H+-transporting ATPase subunit b
MDSCLFLAAGSLGDTVNTVRETFGLNLPHFLAQAFSFAIVAFLLHRFAYKPILTALEDRRQRIAEGLANAEKIKAQLAQAEEEHRKIVMEAGAQANRIMEEARAAAEKELAKRSQEAIATATQIIAKAKESNEAEFARMRAELRKEIGRLVIETTSKVTGKILTTDDQRRLAEETSKELAA